MDMYRAFLAIIISFVILVGYQYLFVGPVQQPAPEAPASAAPQPGQTAVAPAQTAAPPVMATAAPQAQPVAQTPSRQAEEITVDTDLYTVTLSESGGVVTSFILKNYNETSSDDSSGEQLIRTSPEQGYPLSFSWGSAFPQNTLYTLDRKDITFDEQSGRGVVVMRAANDAGLEILRSYEFNRDNYLIKHTATVKNSGGLALQGAGGLHQLNMPFGILGKGSQWLFRGPAFFNEEGLQEFKLKEFKEGKKTVQGMFDWVAYEGTYFMTGIIPEDKSQTITMNAQDELVSIDIVSSLDTLAPGTEKTYTYDLFYGPKKLSLLKESGYNLEKIINFGWFDVIARPMLYLLNWLYNIFGNYGIAIILVTVILKALFWPITQKGLKSMKNMQKLQPKMVKIKEKYKDDAARMNQEVMNLYKTYKVNPLGGCLPMVLQIPVFFSLYKVLLQSIELRHAPFMLWITDLSAPDRLYIGFDIPYLGGLPVLTLLMGASMFLQQKMTPTTADPTQAKIMMFLPVIFTFMFLNFASGLVLYWFVNNLLSILQQYLINRQKKSAPATT
ncbi:MAG: membrane protein insertase YidC [Desulfocapsaceae bacterium]|jgi:YidC/Oxa1 family membrane protein insertase|nr:membrane protein insertase YidC [Desulfocapsaceae bacterium]